VSTLHGNIYYHLGLAHYLKQNWAEALDAYTKCKASGENPDNLVSSSHWLYMINRRMGDMKAANKSIADINADMDIIENFGYHRLCLYYKGEISLEELSGGEGESLSGQDAVDYGIANWHFYNADIENAIRIHKEILNRSSWNSFGYIATEADMNALGDDVLMLN
ncbi:MAG: hypothetical protein KJP00_02665, partial [Bacteroidia bacterium]|nr:hypothetical protein [Bacteroidia bacterium]